MADLNKGFNMEEYNQFKAKMIEDSQNAERNKAASATWVQGEEVRVTVGGKEIIIGADDGMNMMEIMLASLAACDTAMVALHASFMGLKIKTVRAEATGHFNVAAYLGIEGAPGAGYDRMRITLYVDAPDATPEQLANLQHICETGSPVGDTLTRSATVEVRVAKES